MGKSAALITTALATAILYLGCTQDFDQFEPKGTAFTTTGSTSGSGGTGAAGGAGGATSGVGSFVGSGMSSSGTGVGNCTMPTDCGVTTACVIFSCINGYCSGFAEPDGTPVPPADQVPGDCKTIQCDGMGLEKTVTDAQDLPADEPNECTTEECNVDMPAHTPMALGMPCAAGICDGMGACVECLMDGMNTGCMPGDTCDNGMCIGCTDGIQNGMETGVDCGGTCKSCNGTTCTVGTDCVSDNCVDGVCCNATCTAACQGCNVTGSEGTCSNLPLYQDDTFPMDVCTGTMTCNGSGSCRRKNGEPCTQNTQCASNNCLGSGGNKTCMP